MGTSTPHFGRFAAGTGHSVLFEPVQQGLVTQTQEPGRSRPVTLRPLKSLTQKIRLHLFPHETLGRESERAPGAFAPTTDFGRQIVVVQAAVFSQKNQPLDDIRELPDIAGPPVLHKSAKDRLRE